MTHIFFLAWFYRTIGRESEQQKRSATIILFEEWGTSGRIRPTIGHLLQLLVRIEYFRAADYVAVDILKEDPPQRPPNGPAAVIDTTIPEEVLLREIESQLDDVHYPNTESLNTNCPSELANVNRNYKNLLNIDQSKVKNLTAQQTSLTQTNNNSNTIDQQLEQMMDNFEHLSTNTNNRSATERRTTQEQLIENQYTPSDNNLPNLIENSITTNGVSIETQQTNISTEASINDSTSQFIPVMIGEDGLRSFVAMSTDNASTQIPLVISGSGTRSNYTTSTDLSTASELMSSFIPLAVMNGNYSQLTSSKSNHTMENGIRSNGILSTTSIDTNSSYVLIPLSVTNETGNHLLKHNGTSS